MLQCNIIAVFSKFNMNYHSIPQFRLLRPLNLYYLTVFFHKNESFINEQNLVIKRSDGRKIITEKSDLNPPPIETNAFTAKYLTDAASFFSSNRIQIAKLQIYKFSLQGQSPMKNVQQFLPSCIARTAQLS